MSPMEAGDLTVRREALGLSQKGLAGRFGVHYMTISKWERGLHRIPEMVDLALMELERRAGSGRGTPAADGEGQ
jgi:transcriptional regulator with XRE-family HTH domain